MGIKKLQSWLQASEVKRAIEYSLSSDKVDRDKLDLFRIERAIDSRYTFKVKDKLLPVIGVIYIEYRKKCYVYKDGNCTEC